MDIASLREQIDRKHTEALKALETIAGYLTEGSVTPAPAVVLEKPPKGAGTSRKGGKATRVDKVLAVLANEFKTVEQIQEVTKLPDYAVRAVLYSKFVKSRVGTKKIGKRVAFRLKPGEMPPVNGEGRSAAAIVRDLLAKHPEGQTASAINAEVGAEIEKIIGSRAAIGAALYNGKKRGKLVHDEKTGLYRLADRN